MQGIIVENIANLYKVRFEDTLFEASARGRFKKEEISPVVGDVVELEITDEENKKAVINEILERKVYIKRPKMANITQLVFVVSSKDPKPDLLMLDKQLAFAEFLGIKVLIVLNKTDLDDEKNFKESFVSSFKCTTSTCEFKRRCQKLANRFCKMSYKR